MKNLKHYFVSPKGDSKNAESPVINNNSSLHREAVTHKLNAVKELTNNEIVSNHSKKKKRKRVESGEFDEKSVDVENFPTVKENKVSKDPGKKKKTNVLKKSNQKNIPEDLADTAVEVNGCTPELSKKKKIVESDSVKKSRTRRKSSKNPNSDEQTSLLYESSNEEKVTVKVNSKDSRSEKNSVKPERKKRDSNSSKDSSVCNSEGEDRDLATSDNNKSLLNYFSKVDKLPEIEEKPRIIKVEAMVHVPADGGSVKITPKSLRKRKSGKKKSLKIDYDLITLEETESMEVNDPVDALQKPSEMEDKSDQSEKSNTVECIDVTRPIEEEVSKAQKTSVSDRDEVIRDRKKRKLETDQSEDKLSKKKPAIADSDVIFVKEVKKEKPKVKSDGTLASFFQLGRKTPTITSDQMLAKQQFLSSGAPESIKRIAATLSSVQGKEAPFPDKSHVLQKDRMNIMWNLLPVKYHFHDDNEALNIPIWSSILPCQLKLPKKISCEVGSYKHPSSLKDLKNELNLYPISCWYKDLKKLKKGNENSMWTERYRPHVSSTFLANTRSISKLKGWLAELKENSRADSCESSSDEFVKDDEKDSSDRKTVALLSGLPGTGKTAAVYAIAEEVGYNVLEINASHNRSGKKIFNEFSEAMQSHKVGVSKLNFSKVKKKTEDPKRSLILVEDADLLFEDDEGFVSTLINLAAGTKRPIILVVNNAQVKHLSKLLNLCHASLHFTAPSQDRLGSWLRTVSVVEGFSLCPTKAAELASSQDIRRSLLQLQLLNEKVPSGRSIDLEESIWEKVGEYNFRLTKERKKAKRHISSLATLDIIRQNKKNKRIDKPYWLSYPVDSTLTRECEESSSSVLDNYESYFLNLINIKPGSKRFQPPECPRMFNEIEKTAFSMTNILSRRSNALDYWPCFRQISRNEVHRLASHTKRNNRYFNYLSSVGISGPPDFIQNLPTTFTFLS